jgi:hypothetical protein
MEKNNIRFVVASASIIRQLYNLYQWGDLHRTFKMQIPANYIGHYDFHKLGIIKEFYPLTTLENAEQWIQEDILDNYGTDFRVHIVRVNARTVNYVQGACIRKKVKFHNHTSTDKLSPEEIKELFQDSLTEHHVVAVKGLWRRANLFIDAWKMRIGATHELWTKKVDSNVQNQGLPGRLTGYWRSVIEGGHKTGPYRTSIKAIEESEEAFQNPFGAGTFTTNGFHKTESGKVTIKNTMLHPEHWNVEKPVDLPIVPVIPDYLISENFTRPVDAYEWATNNINWEHIDLKDKFTSPTMVTPLNSMGQDDGITKTHMSSRGHRRRDVEPIVARNELVTQQDLSRWGNGVRCVPVTSDSGLQFVIVYKSIWVSERETE